MSFGLGISFGRWCKIQRLKRDIADKTTPPFQRKEIIVKEWESENWYYKESYFEGDEDRLIGEFNGVKIYISKVMKGFIHKDLLKFMKENQ